MEYVSNFAKPHNNFIHAPLIELPLMEFHVIASSLSYLFILLPVFSTISSIA